MVINRISEALFPGDGPRDEEGARELPPLSPEAGAAGLLIEAAQREGGLTEVERDLVDAALMKLFRLTNPRAKEMRAAAESAQAASATATGFAAAAAQLPQETREQLITHLWAVADADNMNTQVERELMRTVETVFGMDRARLLALRPAR